MTCAISLLYIKLPCYFCSLCELLKDALCAFDKSPEFCHFLTFGLHRIFQCHHDFLAQVSWFVFPWLWWTLTKINLREEMLYFILHFMVQFITEGSPGRNSKKKPGDRNWSRSRGRMLITGFLFLACTDTFMIESMPIYLGMALWAMLWPFHNKEQLIKRLTIHPQNFDGSNFQLSLHHSWDL